MNSNIINQVSQTIYARNCIVTLLDLDTAQGFVEENHRSGAHRASQKLVSLALIHAPTEELVGVAQFCYPRTKAKQRKYTTELVRLAFKKGVRVTGGASKLISHYKKVFHPSDLFTYQDMTGEGSKVYEQCGFTLAGQAKKKVYLVAPDRTLATAKRGEYYSIAEVSRRGPDALLGTKLGEVFNEDGSRKTNPQLFEEELGWHIEETAGDRIYEWFNPDVTFYVYKITASDSDKYYYGVSHVKKANATVEDCLNDGYFGSGGVKFQNWRAKHYATLQKEIIGLFNTKAAALMKEQSVVGADYKANPLCLNSMPGGIDFKFAKSTQITTKFCNIHGETKHLGNFCCSCKNLKQISVAVCDIHGLVKFFHGKCYTCQNQNSVQVKECLIHGKVKHQGESCNKCLASNLYSFRRCRIHGRTRHIYSHCFKCLQESVINTKECVIHGISKHFADTCAKCVRSKSITMKICSIHGKTKFSGTNCYKCYLRKTIKLQTCSIHGEVKHRAGNCLNCMNSDKFVEKECKTHGTTKFNQNKCVKCLIANQISIKECPIHGAVKHRGDNCYKCRNAPVVKNCPIHGMTKHRGNSCFKCVKNRR